jgi:glycosyltransferase 2 family protein
LGRKLHLQSTIIGLLIAFGCLALLYRQVDLRNSWKALEQLDGRLMLIPLAIFFVNLPLRAWRWQLIFPAHTRPALGACIVVLGISNMANFLLPGRAGDLARCVLLNRTTSIAGSSRTLATLAVEKVLDGLALLGLALFAAWALQPPRWVIDLLRVAVLIFSTALVLLVVLRYQARSVVRMVRSIMGRIYLQSLEEKFDSLLTSFADGLTAINSAAQMLRLLTLTAAIWMTEAISVWGLALSLRLNISLKSAVMASAILGLGLMIPAAPGGIGTYELFGTQAFKLAGLVAASALALTVAIHAWVFLANVVLGLGLLAVKGIGLAQLRSGVAVGNAAEATHRSS